MKSKLVFQALLHQLHHHTHHNNNIIHTAKQTLYYNNNKTIQSSIGLIFKYNNKHETFNQYQQLSDVINDTNYLSGDSGTHDDDNNQISVLLTQRAGYHKDTNKYNIVFPGGQADNQETDLAACKRQLYEQTKLQVDQKCIYIGRMPDNFYYTQKKNKNIYISCHIWIMKSAYLDFMPQLNKEQLIDYRWVPLEELIDPSNITRYQQKQLVLFKRMGVSYPKTLGYIGNNIEKVVMVGFDVKMGKQLWGLSLWVWGYALMMALNNLKNRKNKNNVIDNIIDNMNMNKQQLQQQKQSIIQLNTIVEQMKQLKLQFKDGFILSKPLKYIANYWHQKYRVQQFKYPSNNNNNIKNNKLLIFIIIGMLVTIICSVLLMLL